MKFRQKIFSISFILILTFLFSSLLLLRTNWDIFDWASPTFLLNMINQVRESFEPAHFPGAPFIEANYHQTNLFVIAIISELLAISSGQGLQIFIIFFGAVAFTMTLYLGFRNNGIILGSLIVLIGYFSASLPTKELLFSATSPVQWYQYLSLFEYHISNSWPLSLFVISILALVFNQKGFSWMAILILMLILPGINAYAFTVMFLAALSLLLFEIKETNYAPRSIAILLGLIILYILPKYYPTAMIMGNSYEELVIFPRFIQSNYFNFALEVLRLNNLFTLFAIPLSIVLAFGKDKVHRYFSIALLVAFFMPFFVSITNISVWDNTHKSVVLSSYLSIINWSLYLKDNILNRKIVLIFLTSVFLSLPANINLFTLRIDAPWVKTNKEHLERLDNNSESLFRDFNINTMFWLYPQKTKCEGFIYFLSKTSAAAAGCYYPSFFLLSKEIESRIKKEQKWYENDFQEILKNYDNYSNIAIAKKVDENSLLNVLKDKRIEFSGRKLIQDYVMYKIHL